MQLRRFLIIVRRRFALLAVIVVAGIVASYLGSSRSSVYQAQTTIFVGVTGTKPDPNTQVGEAFLAATLSTIAVSPTVVQTALTDTNTKRSVAEVTKATKAIEVPGTNLIRITVQDRDPATAKTLANGISTVFVAAAKTLTPLANGKPPATIAQPATLPAAPLATSLSRNLALGGIGALIVGLAVILLLDLVGLSARTPRQLETQIGMPVIGVVPLQPQLEQAGPRGLSHRPGDSLLLVVDDA
jgi:capsular polysaccharide biosynthesis protein